MADHGAEIRGDMILLYSILQTEATLRYNAIFDRRQELVNDF